MGQVGDLIHMEDRLIDVENAVEDHDVELNGLSNRVGEVESTLDETA